MFYIVLRQKLTPRGQWRKDVPAEHIGWAQRFAGAGALVLSGPAENRKWGSICFAAPM